MPQVRRAPAARARAPVRRARAAAPVRRAPVRRAAPLVRRAPKQRSEAGNAFRTGGSTLGGMLGTALGGPAGGVAGSMLGRGAGAMFSKLFGHGDYAVSNVAQLKENNIALANSAQIPQMGSGRVACKFVHREYLGDVFSASTANTFKIDSFPLNPGQSKTFPWLSGVVASKFQQYRINGMTFEFRSMSSDALNSTNTALGSVIMSTDYDSADATFASKQEMENTEYGVSCKPSVNMLHGIECARSQTPVSELYIRAFDVPAGKDIRLYDMGRFSIASTGCQGVNVNLGELWVTYDIDGFKAIEQVPGYLTPYSMYQLNGASATAPLGTNPPTPLLTNADQQIALTFDENKISWPIDIEEGSVWMVDYGMLATAAVALTPPAITTGNGMYINTNVYWKSFTAGTTDVCHLWYIIKYIGGATPAALPYFNIADYTWAATINSGSVVVSQLSGLFAGTYSSQSEITHEDLETDGAPDYVDVEEKKVSCVPLSRLRIKV